MKRLVAIFLAALALRAQSAEDKKLAFDVVSIKPNSSGDTRRVIGFPPGGKFSTTNVPLRQIIVLAYGDQSTGGPPPNLEITGLPGWALTDGYDVQAQPEAGFLGTAQQTQEMLRSMLEERFKLKIRRETKDTPIYALVVGKDGVKMKLSADQTPFGPPPTGAVPPTAPPPSAPPAPGGPAMTATGPIPRGRIMMGLGQLRAGAQTMATLAGLLTGQAGRKVVDKTGVTGLYDIDLKWTPDASPNGAPLPPSSEIDPTGPGLFTAIQEQLGLRLVPDTGKVDTFVVESVQRPSEN
jgi:uncharacterized protein (TIGR03435 family)